VVLLLRSKNSKKERFLIGSFENSTIIEGLLAFYDKWEGSVFFYYSALSILILGANASLPSFRSFVINDFCIEIVGFIQIKIYLWAMQRAPSSKIRDWVNIVLFL